MSTVKLDVENYVDGSYKPKSKKVTWRKAHVIELSKEDEEPDLDPQTEDMLQNLALATDKESSYCNAAGGNLKSAAVLQNR